MDEEDLIVEEKVFQFDYGDFAVEFDIAENTWKAVPYDEDVDQIYILEDEAEGILFEETQVFGVMITESDLEDMKEAVAENSF